MLTEETYFSPENSLKYMSVSQFKAFMQCEASALAEIIGEYAKEKSISLLVGSYIDNYFSNTLDLFKAKHPEIFTKQGELRADYKQAEQIIQRIERDDLFMGLLGGEKQVIMTGEIKDVPFKIKIDSYLKGSAIVDLKIMRDFEWIYNPNIRMREHFVEFYGYDIQGAVYQEIVFQNTGLRLPFYIAAATKESETDLSAMEISQNRLDFCLDYVKDNLSRIVRIKNGEIEPSRCESHKCNYCKKTKRLLEIVDYLQI